MSVFKRFIKHVLGRITQQCFVSPKYSICFAGQRAAIKSWYESEKISFYFILTPKLILVLHRYFFSLAWLILMSKSKISFLIFLRSSFVPSLFFALCQGFEISKDSTMVWTEVIKTPKSRTKTVRYKLKIQLKDPNLKNISDLKNNCSLDRKKDWIVKISFFPLPWASLNGYLVRSYKILAKMFIL